MSSSTLSNEQQFCKQPYPIQGVAAPKQPTVVLGAAGTRAEQPFLRSGNQHEACISPRSSSYMQPVPIL